MNGIVINIDPVIFHLGIFKLHWYGLAIMLAVVAAVLITARRGKKKGIATEEIYSLAIWGALAGGGVALILYARSRCLSLGRLVDVWLQVYLWLR